MLVSITYSSFQTECVKMSTKNELVHRKSPDFSRTKDLRNISTESFVRLENSWLSRSKLNQTRLRFIQAQKKKQKLTANWNLKPTLYLSHLSSQLWLGNVLFLIHNFALKWNELTKQHCWYKSSICYENISRSKSHKHLISAHTYCTICESQVVSSIWIMQAIYTPLPFQTRRA